MSRAAMRTVAGRIGMACYAIWISLALVTQDVTPCPTHDGLAAAAVMAAVMTTTMPAAGMASMPGMSHHASHGAHHACTCVGCGCCAALLDLCAPSRTLVPAPLSVALGTTRPLPPRQAPSTGVDRRLPLANGPPSGVQLTA